MPSLEGLTKSAGSAEIKINFDFNELSSYEFISYKQRSYESFKESDAFCTDGKYIYHYTSERGLYKLSSAFNSKSMPGLIIDSNEDLKSFGDKARMIYFNDRIYIRTIGDKSKPFHVINPDTLKIDEDFPEVKFPEEANSLSLKF